MRQNLEGKLNVTMAALSTISVAVTPIVLVLPERLAGLLRRVT
jgi:hypothetical protein